MAPGIRGFQRDPKCGITLEKCSGFACSPRDSSEGTWLSQESCPQDCLPPPSGTPSPSSFAVRWHSAYLSSAQLTRPGERVPLHSWVSRSAQGSDARLQLVAAEPGPSPGQERVWAPLSASSIHPRWAWAQFFMALLPTLQMRTLRSRGANPKFTQSCSS